MNDFPDELEGFDYADCATRILDAETRMASKTERVIVITGGNDNGAELARMLAGKVGADNYEVLTRAEASERGLLMDDLGEPVPLIGNHETPSWRHGRNNALFGARYGISPAKLGRPQPNPERDRWNAAIDEKKAEKRRWKAETAAYRAEKRRRKGKA